jgi:cellulose 1,4-beta-cellobiosidase
MHWSLITSLLPLGFTVAQQAGHELKEIHPPLQWSSCAADGGCEKVNGSVTMDADFRWLHEVDTFYNCYDGNMWSDRACKSAENCTANCALEGADYTPTYGVKTGNNTLSQRFRTNHNFATNIGSRLYLMESQKRYQTFTLRDNELAFDVDLSTVECGINSALYFVAMDADGGTARYPTNAAGAEYGTGYCDASCPRSVRFVGGQANVEGWIPSATDQYAGAGTMGSCCPQFSVWNSNAHSFAMSSHVCYESGYHVCHAGDCLWNEPYAERGPGRCDATGCSYNPYRMGNKEFYGKGKTVDTSKKFTCVFLRYSLPSFSSILLLSSRFPLCAKHDSPLSKTKVLTHQHFSPASSPNSPPPKSPNSSSKTTPGSTSPPPPSPTSPKKPVCPATCVPNSSPCLANATSWPSSAAGSTTKASCWTSLW